MQSFPVVMNDAERGEPLPTLPPPHIFAVQYWQYTQLPRLRNHHDPSKHQGNRGERNPLWETTEIDVSSEGEVAGDDGSGSDTDEDPAAMKDVCYDTEEEDMTAMEGLVHLADGGKKMDRCALSYLCG